MDHADPTEHRDRIVAALLAEEPTLALLRWDPEMAVLARPEPFMGIHVLAAPPDLPQDRLEYLFSMHTKAVGRGAPPTCIVVVGGGADAVAALRTAAPFSPPVPMGFHHVDEHGAVTHVKGEALPSLAPAALRAAELGEIDPALFTEAIARGQRLVNEERALVDKLSNQRTVTTAITAVCGLLAALGQIWSADARPTALWKLGANSGAAVANGEVYRLFASAFLHGTPVHFIVNMLALWALGPMLEAIVGPRRFLLLYGASALGGSLASAFVGASDARWSVGASGAIWGLMAAGFALAIRPKGVIPDAMARSMRSRALNLLILNVAVSFVPGVDFRAHFGGGLVGFALMATVLTNGLVPVEHRTSSDTAEEHRSRVIDLASAVLGAAMIASVLWGILALKA